MPTRSVNLKLMVPRGAKDKEIAQSLWMTHAVINAATKYYENILLLMRGDEYLNENDESITKAEVLKQQDELVLNALRQNTSEIKQNTDEIRQLLRKIYEAIVPSAIEKSGNAQAANAYLSPLTDKTSKGFTLIFDKIGQIPAWVEQVRDGLVDGFEEAEKWLATDEGQSRLKATGAPTKWMRSAREGNQDWPIKFIEDLDKKREEVQGTPTLFQQLRKLKVIPLFTPHIAPRLSTTEGVVSAWDRLAFRLAVGHLLSWESWSIKAKKEHASRTKRVNDFIEKHIKGELDTDFTHLDIYQKERKAQLNQLGLPSERPFRINQRMIRGWHDLKEKWTKASNHDEGNLLEIIAKEQTRQRNKFGDPDFFRWLAKPEQHNLWGTDKKKDPVELIAQYNALLSLLERSREYARMTLPDPRYHPRTVEWEAEGGANLKNYQFKINDFNMLQVTLPLLMSREKGVLNDYIQTLQVSKSGQFKNVRLSKKGKIIHVSFENDNKEVFTGKLGSADLLMNWDYLMNRPVDMVEDGDIGSVYLKLAIDIDAKISDDWESKRPTIVNHFLTASGQKTKYEDGLKAGLRVLSVDLGMRSFATCSVFELQPDDVDSRFAFDIDGVGLRAVHERSFTLKLPNEEVDKGSKQWRSNVSSELRRLRRTLGRYRSIRKFINLAEMDRQLLLEDLSSSFDSDDVWPFERKLKEKLIGNINLPDPVWNDLVNEVLAEFKNHFGILVKEWRKANKARSDDKSMGKSMWAINYLIEVRRFLQSWSTLGRESGEIRRLDRAKQGIFAGHLLRHIDRMKNDRLKTGSDLIVQAARGYIRNHQGRWLKNFNPCQVILFEDLSRYRMRTDRPRRENSQLMKWAHRSVPEEVKMQGELYGLHVCDTAAAFTSRFHALSDTPGIRCHALTKDNISDSAFIDIIKQENPNLKTDSLHAGRLVPLTGGELFACVTGNGITQIHADINAAQNLQRRFWTRHKTAFRLPSKKVTLAGDELWVPRSMGKRLKGALGSYGQLVPTGHESGSCRWEKISGARWRKLVGETNDEDTDSTPEELLDLAGIEDEMLERSGEITTFFRDPSGLLLPVDLWYPAKTFWSIVKTKTVAAINS